MPYEVNVTTRLNVAMMPDLPTMPMILLEKKTILKYLPKLNIHPWTEVVYHLESKKALFYIFDFAGSVFENSKKPLF